MESKSMRTTDLPKQNYLLNTVKAFEEYSDMVYRLAFVRTSSKCDAEDILSEVFLRLLKNQTKIKNEGHLKAWLIRATLNCTNSLLSSAYRRRRVDLTEAADIAGQETEVLPLVLALPLKYKTVIYMYYYEGYSVEEISALCSIAVGTVKSRLARARQRLKDQLKGEMIDV